MGNNIKSDTADHMLNKMAKDISASKDKNLKEPNFEFLEDSAVFIEDNDGFRCAPQVYKSHTELEADAENAFSEKVKGIYAASEDKVDQIAKALDTLDAGLCTRVTKLEAELAEAKEDFKSVKAALVSLVNMLMVETGGNPGCGGCNGSC